MITVTGAEIKKDGANVVFPIDGGGRPSAMLVGFDENEAIQAVRVNAEGKLLVDSSVTVDGVTIGEVGLTAQDSAGAVGVVHREANGTIPATSSLMTRDIRFKFNGDEVKTLSYGSTGAADVPLSVNALGQLNVNVISAAATTMISQDALFSAAPAATVDALTDVLNMNVRHFLNKTVVIKNTGAASVGLTIIASVDNGASFPIPLATNYEVVAGSTYVYTHNNAVTHVKIQMKSYVAGTPTTVGITAYAMGA